ncbi:MAG: hypothetical protein GC184_14040 [Rhizobiales bacterium]|nr:hypothetical protein [Hyphomicrobiales bacterium]
MTGMTRFTIGLLVLAIAQTLFLGWMIAGRIAILNSPTVVSLKTEPVDPRDIFRGDYVILRYGISTVKLDLADAPDTLKSGATVYVTLAARGDTWQAVALSKTKPARQADHPFIRGRISYVDRSPDATAIPGRKAEPCVTCNAAHIEYGIESYFVPEGEGRPIEQARNERALMVDVALADDGEAAIKSLKLDGTPLYTEPLF